LSVAIIVPWLQALAHTLAPDAVALGQRPLHLIDLDEQIEQIARYQRLTPYRQPVHVAYGVIGRHDVHLPLTLGINNTS
jgi:hypothetical protein